ncbi:MAG: hypothetical protein WBB23_17215 [Desulforhopalus sp.]
MDSEVSQLKRRLKKIDEEIAETLRRLPAHSAKPPVMQDLLELEDERDSLVQKLREIS